MAIDEKHKNSISIHSHSRTGKDEKDSEAFAQKCEPQQQDLRNKIQKAQKLLDKVTYDDSILEMAAKISIEMEVDGHRAALILKRHLQRGKEIVKRRLEYEKSPLDFIEKWRLESDVLAQQIKDAKQYLNRVQVSDNVMKLAAEIAKEANCAGHRAELVIVETQRRRQKDQNQNRY